MGGYNLPDHVSARDFDDDPEPPLHDCPECGAEDAANRVIARGDEDGYRVLPCDECAKPCECGEKPCAKVNGKCADCRALEVLP